MKNHEDLIGRIIIAAAIIIAALIIAGAITGASSNIHGGLSYMGEMIRSSL